MPRTLEDLEKATQTELNAIAVSHERLEAIRQERDELIAKQAALAKNGGAGVTIAVPAAKFKAKAG